MGWVRGQSGKIGFDGVEKGDRTPIVFLHGVGSDKSVWAPQIAHFGRERTAIALEYPGYGESEPLPDATREDFAAAILSALETLGIDKAHVCGLSLGGVIAIAMYAMAPKRCASLILADSFAVHPEGQAIYERSVEASRKLGMRALAEARAGMLLGSAATDALCGEVVETMAAIDPGAYRAGAKAVWLADQRDRAAAIAVPTLVLCGTEDRITPPDLSVELAALIPGARLQLIAGAGHLANAEQPVKFNAAIDRFLTDIE